MQWQKEACDGMVRGWWYRERLAGSLGTLALGCHHRVRAPAPHSVRSKTSLLLRVSLTSTRKPPGDSAECLETRPEMATLSPPSAPEYERSLAQAPQGLFSSSTHATLLPLLCTLSIFVSDEKVFSDRSTCVWLS